MLAEDAPMTRAFHDLIQGMDGEWVQQAAEKGVDARGALHRLRTTARELSASKSR